MRTWTSEEECYLIDNYNSKLNNELASDLNKTVSSIEHKAIRLGIRKDRDFVNEHLALQKLGDGNPNWKGGDLQQLAYESQLRDKQKFPEKKKARSFVGHAIRDGRMNKGIECQVCGSKDNIEAHHVDYSTPEDVRWICSDCHRKLHGGELCLN